MRTGITSVTRSRRFRHREPLRLAFDAGVKDAESIPKDGFSPTIDHGPQYPSLGQHMPLDVWMRVLAEETRRGIY